jgi:hypothetical protein
MFQTAKFNKWLLDQIDLFLHYLPPLWVVGPLVFLLVTTSVVAPRLGYFNRPSWFHKNTLIRLLGRTSFWISTVCLVVVFMVFGLVVIAAVQTHVVDQLWELVEKHVEVIGIGLVAGLFSGFVLRVFLIPDLEKEETSQSVDDYIAEVQTKSEFDPRPFFGRQSNGVFIGKDEHDRPVFVSWARINSTHIPFAGATGCGKGIALQTFTAQAHRAGQAVIVFDPKPCKILPRILFQESLKSKRAMHFFDLQKPVAQFSLLRGMSKASCIDLLTEIFELKKTGEPKSDHYKDKAQTAIRELASLAVQSSEVMTFQSLLSLARSVPEIAESENLMSALVRFASFDQFHTTAGIDLEQAICRGEVIYVAGDGSSEDIASMQRAFLSRVTMFLASRKDTTVPVCLVVDEVSDLLTPTLLSLLSKLRSQNVHAILAFQTPGDLRAARGVDPDVAFSKCWGNTTIKLVYHLEEVKYAKEIAQRIGEETEHARTVSRDPVTGDIKETWATKRGFKVQPHDITNLPMPEAGSGQAAMGFLIGAGPAKLVYLGPIPIDRNIPGPTICEAKRAEVVGAPEEKI